MVDSFLGWLSPSSGTAFTLYSKEEDESHTGSERDGKGGGALFDRQPDHFGFRCRLGVTVTIQRELSGLSKHSKIKYWLYKLP